MVLPWEATVISPATISRELRRNALASGAYRPTIAEGSYLLRRQRPSVLERDPALAEYVTDRHISFRSSGRRASFVQANSRTSPALNMAVIPLAIFIGSCILYVANIDPCLYG